MASSKDQYLPDRGEILEAAGIRYGQALVGFTKVSRRYHPELEGYVIDADYKKRLNNASETVAKIK